VIRANGNGSSWHVYGTKADGDQPARWRMARGEGKPHVIAIDLCGEAADVPDEVMQELLRTVARVVDRHVRLKALGTKRIIVPRSILN
jgi:hypothetical protein